MGSPVYYMLTAPLQRCHIHPDTKREQDCSLITEAINKTSRHMMLILRFKTQTIFNELEKAI